MVLGFIPTKIFCLLISLLIFLVGEQLFNKSFSCNKTSLSDRINNTSNIEDNTNFNQSSSTLYGKFYNKHMQSKINANKLSKKLNMNLLDLNDKISESNLKNFLTAEEILSLKLLGVIGLIICLSMTLLTFNLKFFFLGIILYIVGGIIPQRYINGKIKERKNEIIKTLPDFLDLLRSITESGLAIQEALKQVIVRLDGPLAEEFQKVMIESKTNGQWRYAMENMAFRNNIDSLSDIVSDILVSCDRGTPISEVLEKESIMMRKIKNSRSQEKAKKMSIKLIIPMAIFNFMPLMFLMIAPMIMEMSKDF